TARGVEYAAAFREYGLDLEQMSDTKAAERLRARPIYRELPAALDDWAFVTPQAKDRARLRALAQAADPDDDRTRLREALAKEGVQALTALAASDRAASLPAPTAVLLAKALRRQKAFREAEAVLRQAQQRFPSDFWVDSELGSLFSNQDRPQWD